MFKCQLCKDFETTSSKVNLAKHVEMRHRMAFQKFEEVYMEKSMVQKERHRCRLCDQIIFKNMYDLKNHLKDIHDGMEIAVYYANHIVVEDKVSAGEVDTKVGPEELDVVADKPLDSDGPEIGTTAAAQNKVSSFLSVDAAEEKSDLKMCTAKKKKTAPRRQPSATLWANKCTFSCLACDFVTKAKGRFINHVQEEHQLSFNEFLKKWGDPTTSTAMHVCLLCNKKIYRTNYDIKAHLQSQHKMTVVQYHKKHVLKEDSTESRHQSEASPKVKSLRPLRSSPPSPKKTTSKLKEGTTSKLKEGTIAYEAKVWSEKCEFRCFCGHESNSEDLIHKHFREVHNLVGRDAYREKHGDPTVTKAMHSCKICQMELMHTNLKLRKHFKQKHNIRVIEYYTKYVLPHKGISSDQPSPQASCTWADACLFKCFCSYETSSQSVFLTHTHDEHNLSLTTYTEKHGDPIADVAYHVCKLCEKELTHTYDDLRDHLKYHDLTVEEYHEKHIAGKPLKSPRKKPQSESKTAVEENSAIDNSSLQENVRKWANQCIFKCFCNEVKNSKTKMFHHVRQQHGMSWRNYKDKYGDPLFVKVEHCCKICNKMFLLNDMDARDHLKTENLHPGLSTPRLVDYYSKHILNNGPKQNSDQQKQLIAGKDNFKHPQVQVSRERKTSSDVSSNLGYEENINHVLDPTVASRIGQSNLVVKKQSVKKSGISSERLYLLDKCTESTSESVKKMASDWVHKNVYKCKICKNNVEYSVKANFLTHLRRAHQILGSKYSAKYGGGRLTTNLQKTTCAVCNGLVECDYNAMYKHFYGSKKHSGLNITLYYQLFVNPFVMIEGWEPVCRLCDSNFADSVEFVDHLNSKHHLTASDYCSQFKLLSENKFECQLCFKNLSEDYRLLYKHFSEKHDVSLFDYYSLNHPSPGTVESQQKQIAPESEVEVANNCCVLQCRICRPQVNFGSVTTFKEHVLSSHEMTFKKYSRQVGSPWLSLVFTECHICQKPIIHDFMTVRLHIENVHAASMYTTI